MSDSWATRLAPVVGDCSRCERTVWGRVDPTQTNVSPNNPVRLMCSACEKPLLAGPPGSRYAELSREEIRAVRGVVEG